MKRQSRIQRPRLGRRPSGSAAPQRDRDLTIVEMGARGDAVAHNEAGAPIYAPFALPGERVRARIAGERAEVLEVLEASTERRAPACRHFGTCGGCQLQHWEQGAYLAWKRARVVDALAKRNIGFDVAPIIPAWGEGRRRAAFHAGRWNGQSRIGFIERGGARLMPISACPALTPALEAAALKLAPLADLFVPQRGEITLQCLATETGIDVAIKGAGRADALDRGTLEQAAALAANLGRLSVDGEPLVTHAAPLLRMGVARVRPPPGAFLQPTALGEEVLAKLALEALTGASRVIDLFSGVGTFALRIAQFAEVQAAESSAEMLAALKAAADGAGGALKQVTVLRRDLLRTPLSSLEMKRFDAAVIDPPRSGARLQVEQIARAGVRKLAYVSCDPSTFARDVKLLTDHGFTLTKVTPVDQFRWSPHVEIVGALER